MLGKSFHLHESVAGVRGDPLQRLAPGTRSELGSRGSYERLP